MKVAERWISGNFTSADRKVTSHQRRSDRNLSSIPAQISELAHFVAISESSERSLASVNLLGAEAQKKDFLRASRRVTTAPADVFSSRAAILERAQSIMGCSVGFPREELQLFLAGNCISAIPSQLFLLDRLTVLSLRKSLFPT